jgi:hypothetical protein
MQSFAFPLQQYFVPVQRRAVLNSGTQRKIIIVILSEKEDFTLGRIKP